MIRKNSSSRLPGGTATLLAGIAATFALSGCARAQNVPAAPLANTTTGTTTKAFLGANGFIPDSYWVDLMKSASINSLDAKVPLAFDEHHWPTMDCGMGFINNGYHIDAVKVNPAASKEIGGVYHLSFVCANPDVKLDGGQPAFKILSHSYDAASKTWKGDLEVPQGAQDFSVNFHDTKGGVRDVRCIRPGYAANTTQVYTNEFKKLMAPFSVWRPLSDQGHGVPQYPQMLEWNERDLPDLPSVNQIKTSYWPWEWQIGMANFLDSDLWINVPINASDDYVRQLAVLLRDGDTVDGVKYPGLKPNLNVYVEYSNEVWNFGFQQPFWNYRAAHAEVDKGNSFAPIAVPNSDNDGTNEFGNGVRHYAERSARISQMFRKVWGDGAMNTRVRPVLMWTGINTEQLDYIERWFGPVKNLFYAVGAAPYFGPENTNGMTVDQLFASADNSQPLRGRNPNAAWFHANALRQNRTLATFYGEHYAAYELGFDAGSDESGQFTQARYDMNYDPRAKATVGNFLQTWFADGGELLVYSSLYGVYFRYGTFPLTENPINLEAAPKYQAVAAIAGKPKPPVTAGVVVSATGPTTINTADYDVYPEGRTYPQKDGNGGTYVNIGRNAPTYRTVLLRVAAPGNYSISVNASGQKGDLAQVIVDNQPLANLEVPAAPVPDAGKAWATTAPVVATLSAGLHALRFAAINNPKDQWYYGNINISPGGTPDLKSKPGAPRGVGALAQNKQNLVFWQKAASSAGEATYTVYRGTKAGGEDAKPLKIGITKLSFADMGLSNNTPYFYKVAAVNANGASEMSEEVSSTPTPRPARLADLKATVEGGKVTLHFSAAPDALLYNVYRSDKPSQNDKPAASRSPFTFATLNAGVPSRGNWDGALKVPQWESTMNGTSISFVDNEAKGTTYYYQVAAVNGAGEGPMSPEVH